MRVFIFAASFFVIGCTGSVPDEFDYKDPLQRCVLNEDCTDGQWCRDYFCEDIYHPPSKIGR